MSKLALDFKITDNYDRQNFSSILREIMNQVNPLSEGRLSARYNAQSTVPSGTAASYAVGDIVWDSNCTVRGSVAPGVAASYVRLGWVCTSSGSPGTFVEMRVLTGT